MLEPRSSLFSDEKIRYTLCSELSGSICFGLNPTERSGYIKNRLNQDGKDDMKIEDLLLDIGMLVRYKLQLIPD